MHSLAPSLRAAALVAVISLMAAPSQATAQAPHPLSSLVPGAAGAVFRVDFAGLRGSPHFATLRTLVERAGHDPDAPDADAHRAMTRRILDATAEVVLASTGPELDEERMLVMMRGSFPADMLAHSRSTADRIVAYQGSDLIFREGKVGVLVGDHTFALGPEAAVRALVDGLASPTAPAGLQNADLQRLADTVGLWTSQVAGVLLATDELRRGWGEEEPAAAQIVAVAGEVTLTNGLVAELVLEQPNAAAARRLRGVMNRELARARRDREVREMGMDRLLRQVRIGARGRVVTVRATITEAQMAPILGILAGMARG